MGVYAQTPAPSDAASYNRFALGPLRPAPPSGRGWLYACGELVMTAHDLALWDISLLQHRLLTPAMELMTEPVRLRDGTATNYALGLAVSGSGRRLMWTHGGGISGFTSVNTVWPDKAAAIVVLANEDNSTSPLLTTTSKIARHLLHLPYDGIEYGPDRADTIDGDGSARLAAITQAQRILYGLANGQIDRNLLTVDGSAYFTQQVLDDIGASLRALGPPATLKQYQAEMRGGLICRHFEVKFKRQSLYLDTQTVPGGKLEEYQLHPE